jgi:hypothetical protein
LVEDDHQLPDEKADRPILAVYGQKAHDKPILAAYGQKTQDKQKPDWPSDDLS